MGTKAQTSVSAAAAPLEEAYKYLEARPHWWRKQLYVKGHRLRASDISYWVAQGTTREEAAANWDLPLEAIDECLRYSESHRELLDKEAEQERQYLIQQGVAIEPPPTR